MQESQPLVEADTAMAWKRLRPSVLYTVCKSLYIGASISILAATTAGLLYSLLTYVSYQTTFSCEYRPGESIPVKIQWLRTISTVIAKIFLYMWFLMGFLFLFRPYQLSGVKIHWTKKWIYIKFAQRKGIANISLLQSKPVANVVKSTFATIFAHQCKYGSKCGLYHVCYRFALEQRYVCNTFALCKYNVNPFFRPRKCAAVAFCLFCLEALYRLAFQIFQISHSRLSKLQTLPLNAIFLISVIWQLYFIVNHFGALANGRRVYLFLKMIMPSFFSFVLGILITTFIYPWYNDANDRGKYMIALFSPLTGVVFKVISRICVQRLWNITHPGYSYVLLVPSYFFIAINFRALQADLDSVKSIATVGIIHGSAEVIERSAIVFIDHICNMIWKRSSAPWGHFRTPRRERFMADIVIISMLYEAAAIVCVNSVWFL